MKIKIEKLTEDQISKQGIRNWPIWTKEESTFDWFYDSTEQCLILEGEITVRTDDETVHIKPGDFVTFPKGMQCVWEVHKPVRKHFNFED